MVYLAVIVLLMLAVIFALTRERGTPDGEISEGDDALVADVADLVIEGRKEFLPAASHPVLGGVLRELLGRLGIEAEQVLVDRGFSQGAVAKHTDEERNRNLRLFDPAEDMMQVVERAMLVGIQLARADDDYAGVGDDHLDLEALVRKAEAIEMDLFGDGKRERYVFYGKAALVLQDMLQDEREAARREVLRGLLEMVDARINAYQEDLERSMAYIPEPDTLRWGDRRDRQLYYFKMGVTNSLRRSGQLESLGHLYRYRGVNYDVLEAYDLAAQECPQLFAADVIGIDGLLQMASGEVRALARQALPEGGRR
ncbi:MAG: hypothetical protein J4F39_07165 [Candidatus Latescibacteria bacterium]|nr:hypothetical protein [Candidatus Latescibacterota bacterium]